LPAKFSVRCGDPSQPFPVWGVPSTLATPKASSPAQHWAPLSMARSALPPLRALSIGSNASYFNEIEGLPRTGFPVFVVSWWRGGPARMVIVPDRYRIAGWERLLQSLVQPAIVIAFWFGSTRHGHCISVKPARITRRRGTPRCPRLPVQSWLLLVSGHREDDQFRRLHFEAIKPAPRFSTKAT
jgi:hypothetical protein